MNLFHTKEPFVFYVKMGDLPIRKTTTGCQKSQGHIRLWQFGFDRQLVFFAPESINQIGGSDQVISRHKLPGASFTDWTGGRTGCSPALNWSRFWSCRRC